tara:strand:+ start:2760 stop:3860 length:1101 start_codon:yes stop_codon:yes gene_type:complete
MNFSKSIKISAIILVLIFILSASRVAIYFGLFESKPTIVDEEIQITEVADGLGQPTCLDWISSEWLLVCDTHMDSILALQLVEGEFTEPKTIITDLINPHGVVLWENYEKTMSKLFVSQTGKLESWNISGGDSPDKWELDKPEIVIGGIERGIHQQNGIIKTPENNLIWHSGSTCNLCDEIDNRSATLIEIDPETGNYSIIATGVRNSFDGVWVPDIGYIFTDNGHDWGGDIFPPEEINLLEKGGFYGWPNTSSNNPIPLGSIPSIGNYTPHSSVNGIDLRPENSTLPGGKNTLYATVFGSWNTVIPVGKEIIRIDLVNDSTHPQGWGVEITVIIENLGTPLSLRFHPDGDLYFSDYSKGILYKVE